MTDSKNGIGKPIDRRSLLMLMAATGGVAAFGGGMASPARADTAKFELENDKYLKLYDEVPGYYFQNEEWVKQTTERLTWPADGTKVPPLRVLLLNTEPHWIDAFRKWAEDAAQIGLRYEIQQASLARWLESVQAHMHGDIEVHPSVLRPERVDPSEWLVSRAYGLDRRNYGEWVNEEYDALIDKQTAEGNPEKRLGYVKAAQQVLADDMYCNQFGWGPAIIEAYNAADWDNVVKTTGFGIANFNVYHAFLKMTPKGDRKSVRVGMRALLETTNIIAAGNNMRSIGRMIYDRLAFFDEKLNVIPWALESWEQVDERTWDVRLRDGMEFHDGKPVTIDDLQFTFDFMTKFERGIFWTANRFLESTQITDHANRVMRITFKQPYGQFESYFLQLNVILPKHIWQNIMEEQGVGEDPRRLRIDKPIGSGPFKFGHYRRDAQFQMIADKKHFSKPVPDDIWCIVSPTVDGLLGRLSTQEIDMIESSAISLTPSQAKQFADHPAVEVVHTDDINWLHGMARVSWLPWRDFEFRRAWQHSIDRQFLVQVPWEGAGRVPTSNTFLVEGNPWHNPDLPAQPEFDMKKAREILLAAGYTFAKDDGRLVYPSSSDSAYRERVTKVVKDGYTWGGLKMLG